VAEVRMSPSKRSARKRGSRIARDVRALAECSRVLACILRKLQLPYDAFFATGIGDYRIATTL
jgi:hypothetical protein